MVAQNLFEHHHPFGFGTGNASQILSEANKCQFSMGWDPFWAWVYSVSDPQDSIKELLNCVLRPLGTKTAACWACAFDTDGSLSFS